MNYVLGIDPGKNGGMAMIRLDGKEYHCWGMASMTYKERIDQVAQVVDDVCMTYLERVGARPNDGRSSIFKFGTDNGVWIGALLACGVPYELITPTKWQIGMRCLTKGDKKVTRARAQELFPKVKVTHQTADALLIAAYCQRKMGAIGAKVDFSA